MSKADIGLIGLAVMGENLGRAKGKKIIGTHTPEDLVANLASPRRVMIMVKAGKPVDMVIDQLVPLLEKGDIIIDGGNSYWPDTQRPPRILPTKASCTSAPACPAARKARSKARRSCPAATPRPGRT